MQRRDFLAASAGIAVTTVASTSEAGPVQPPPIIDTHLHLWDLNRFRLPWVTKDSPLNRSYVMKDFLTATQGLNVVKAVYMEVDVDVKQQNAEADYVTEICRDNTTPMKAAVISGRPASEGFRDCMRRFRDNRAIKGIRQVLHVPETPAGFCLRENFVRGLRVLDEMGLSYDLCMRPTDLGDAVKLTESLPNLKFILDHCGNGPVFTRDRTQWQRDMERVARSKNVMCKVSGIIAQCQPGKWRAEDLAPVINHTIDTFGPDRVMFAGDWPVCTLGATYRQWVEALQAIVRNRPAEHQRKLFHDNASRFYGI